MSPPISRKEFLRTVAAGAAVLYAGGSAISLENQKQKPNILFIVSDDLNDWIGCLGGHPDTQTPNIDRLGRRRVVFEWSYCTSPLCNPSRASLMNGVLPSATGVYDNRQPFRKSEAIKSSITLPQYLMANGYYTAAAGKIYHMKFPDPPSWNDYGPTEGDPSPKKKSVNGIFDLGFDWGPVDADDSEMGDFKTVEYCIRHKIPMKE